MSDSPWRIEKGPVYTIAYNSKEYAAASGTKVTDVRFAMLMRHETALQFLEGLWGWRWPLRASILLNPRR